MTIFYVTGLLEELVNGVCSIFEILSASIRRHIATARFLKLIDEENPASRYKIEKLGKPVECAVCLSKLEKGEKIRNLKCNHTFHKVCVDTWLQQDSAVTCLVCRSAVLPEEIMVKLRPQRNDNQVYDRSDREEIVSLLLSAIDEELVNGVCSTFEILSASIRRHIATARFLKLIDEENPASRYKIGKRGKPVECAVCLSKLEKGEKIRNLKSRVCEIRVTAKGESGGFVRGMKGVLEECEEEIRAHADGLAASEDHTEGVGSGDGVCGRGAAVAVLGGGGVPKGGGGGGRVDSVISAGSERVHGESQAKSADDVESPDLPAKSSHQSRPSPLGQTQQSSSKGHHRQPR
ncbi:hypothetical protein C3L33_18143, partial [Rhododendron williamsianum]